MEENGLFSFFQLLIQALSSLSQVYMRRNLTADQWRSAQMLSLVAAPQQMLYAAQTDTVCIFHFCIYNTIWLHLLQNIW